MKDIADAWSKYILDLMVELEIIGQSTIKEPRKQPAHGPYCLCQDCCDYYHDECACGDNEIITAVQERLRKDWGVDE